MNSSYRHLTLLERESIMIMCSHNKKITEITQAIGRSTSTVSRELERHSMLEYRASLVQQSYQRHRKNTVRCRN